MMNKLLLLTNSIPEYRIPVYKKLGNYFNLTVAHYGKRAESIELNFNQLILQPKKFGPFTYFKENIYQLANDFDAVLAMGELSVISYILLGFRHQRRFSLTFWGGDVSFSYTKRYDEDKRLDKIRFFLMNRADSLVFYCNYPVNRYVKDGKIDPKKLFVAHNTIDIPEKINIPEVKNYFLFVGTLYKAKKIYDLLNAYHETYKKIPDLQPLVIVGDGDEIDAIKLWIKENELNDHILLKGAIYDQNTLKVIFQNAICTISPGQAGLSVLNSMAYGVPFVTSRNAFTGGEIFNISNGINGFLYDGTVSTLSSIIEKLSRNPKVVYQLSIEAQNYYFSNATLELMVNGLVDSVMYALKKREEKSF